MSDSKSAGLGFCDVLLIVFIVLKLIGIINWGWLRASPFLFSPYWVGGDSH